MLPFEEEDHEPVAVVRTLSDFALALTLIVLMLIGTRSAAEHKAETRAATPQSAGAAAEMTLRLSEAGKFTLLSADSKGPALEQTAAEVATPWIEAHRATAATIVLEFGARTLAADLHRALLELQSAFGTNLARIDTVPDL